MFFRLVTHSLVRQRRRRLVAGAAIALGAGVVTAMLAVTTDIGDKMSAELRGYGSNIIVRPADAALRVDLAGVDYRPIGARPYLDEKTLPNIKQMFWQHAIVGFAPMLSVRLSTGGTLIGTYFAKSVPSAAGAVVTGVRTTHPWWKIDGRWPADDTNEVMAGRRIAQRLNLRIGDRLQSISGAPVLVSILTTGDDTEQAFVGPLAMAQRVAGKRGAVDEVFVSAVTKPDDAFARQDLRTMSPADLERWSCSPYVSSIAFAIEQAIPGSTARPIRRIADSEGVVLRRVQGLMALLAAGAFIESALAVAAAMATVILERRREIGLLKALGAGDGVLAALFFVECAAMALVAGTIGFGGGVAIAHAMGRSIFGTLIAVQPIVYPLVLAVALLTTLVGAAGSVVRATRLEPALVLRGNC